MTPTSTSDGSQVPAGSNTQFKWGRYLFGFVSGFLVGGFIGWLIDSALTSNPYIGVRVGSFVGGLSGGVVGGGGGWRGIGVLFSMMLLAAGGASLGLALWNPGPNNLLMFIPAGVGGIAGAFTGLVAALAVINRRHAKLSAARVEGE